MRQTSDPIEKQTIILRLAASIYKMSDHQLALLLDALEQHADAGHGNAEDLKLKSYSGKNDALQRQMVIARIFVVIGQLDTNALLHRLRALDDPEFKWVRQFPRLACYLLVDFATRDKAYRSCIRDISANGVFIETADTFAVGQEVALCFAFSEADETMPFKIKGHVARVYADGIGVQYDQMTHYRREILNTLINRIC